MILSQLPPATIQKLKEFAQLFFEKNQQLNLSSIRDKEGIWLKHVHDSLLALEAGFDFSKIKTVLDLGTGGGLPGIPLAIVFPEKRFTLMDATGKKIAAVQEFIRELGLQNAVAMQGRAEEWAHHGRYRGLFDLVVMRAVAEMNALAEYALPFAKQGGHLIAYKGKDPEQEIRRAASAIKKLGGKIEAVVSMNVSGLGERSFVIVRKEESTPSAYPRQGGAIKKKPL